MLHHHTRAWWMHVTHHWLQSETGLGWGPHTRAWLWLSSAHLSLSGETEQKCHMKQEQCCMKGEQPWNMPWRISAWGWAGSVTRVSAAAPPVLLRSQSWVTAKEHTEDKQMPLFLECMHCSFICAVALFSMYSHTSSAPPLRSSLEATSQL